MPFRTCDHLKEDGVYCSSPALRGRNFCYFHLTLRGRRLKAAQARRRGELPTLNLPFPEDMYAVQVSLHEVMQGLVTHTLDPKNAGLLLYALQQASTNLLQTPDWKGRCEPVEPEQPLLALDLPAFEEQYQLPKGIDLDAEPEAALAESEASPDFHPERGRAGQAPVRVEGPAVPAAETDMQGAPSLPLSLDAKGGNETPAPRKKPRRARGARVPLEKELWEHDDPDAPFRAYTSDGRELTREDAKRWHQRQMQDLEKFIRETAESEDAA